MQVGRLFEIIYILIDKKQVTAKELAEHFEVSVRTIFRDVDTLCEAGIPIYTSKGKGGGIRLMDNFILNKSVLSAREQQEIITALQSLKATQNTDSRVLTKLNAFFGGETTEWINIDFGGWSSVAKEKFELIKEAILQRKVISFAYYNAKMEISVRRVEPMQLSFIDKTWYVKAYCLMRKQMRLFKLTRIRELQMTDEVYSVRSDIEELDNMREHTSRNEIHIKLQFDKELAYRVFDEFEEGEIETADDGSFIVEVSYAHDNWLYSYLLSFGPYVKVLEPKSVSDKLEKQIRAMMNKYL